VRGTDDRDREEQRFKQGNRRERVGEKASKESKDDWIDVEGERRERQE